MQPANAPSPYVAPPTTCERLVTLCARARGSVTLQPGAEARRVEYALPAHATAEIRANLAREAAVEYDAEVVARFAGGRVFGAGAVLSPDGRALARDVSWDFGRPWDEHWLLGYQKIRPPQRLEGTVAVIATALGDGYAHWLLEELPRLLALGPDAGGAETVIAHTEHAFSRAALTLHGSTGEIIEPGRYSHYECAQLVVPSLSGREGYPTPLVLDRLAELVEPWHEAGPSPWGERLYITRETARRRRVVNEAELWAALESRGFVKLRLEELLWREQISAFQRARVVVAPHGAGLANLAFAREGATVVELFNRAYVNGVFWRLAALQELDYRPLVAEGTEPLAQIAARNREDIVVDVAQVMRALV